MADEADSVSKPGASAAVSQRLDKWLWCARLARTRTQASALVSGGKIRINRIKTDKPAHAVKVGDVITASLGPKVRVLAVKSLGDRRGSADIARLLFDDLSAPTDPPDGMSKPEPEIPSGLRDSGAGRPTKRDRRLTDRLKGDF